MTAKRKIDPQHLLQEVANTTGRNILVVERVLSLVMAVHSYGHFLIMREDKLADVAMPGHDVGPLPAALCDEIEESGADIIELLGAIHRAIRARKSGGLSLN
jgi:hypothetical protein